MFQCCRYGRVGVKSNIYSLFVCMPLAISIRLKNMSGENCTDINDSELRKDVKLTHYTIASESALDPLLNQNSHTCNRKYTHYLIMAQIRATDQTCTMSTKCKTISRIQLTWTWKFRFTKPNRMPFLQSSLVSFIAFLRNWILHWLLVSTHLLQSLCYFIILNIKIAPYS